MGRSFATMMGTAALALAASTVAAQDVSYDYDRTTDFTQLKTYAWVAGTHLRDELNHKRIVAAIEAQMAAKGFVKADSGQADVLLSDHTAFDRNLEVSGYSSGWGPYRYGRTGTARVEEIVTGSLAVVMVDARSKTVIWRGIASKDLDLNASPEKRDKNINKAAEKLFRKYPPQA